MFKILLRSYKLRKLLVMTCVLFVSSMLAFGENVVVPKNGTPVFVKYESMWTFSNDGDIEKPLKDVKAKTLLHFGNKVTVTGNKKIKDKFYLYVILPDSSKVWGPMDYFTEKFIVINQANVSTFTQPDKSYVGKIKLQPGYLGYLIKEKDGFINAEFYHYSAKTEKDKPVWIGEVWISGGYTDKIDAATQASYLRLAYNYMYGKTPDLKAATAALNNGLNALDGAESEVAYVLKAELDKLGGTAPAAEQTAKPVEAVVGKFYTTTFDNLRFRATPGADGNIVRKLKIGEKLTLLEKESEPEVINGTKGYWCKFETTAGEIGWVFDGFIVEYKE